MKEGNHEDEYGPDVSVRYRERTVHEEDARDGEGVLTEEHISSLKTPLLNPTEELLWGRLQELHSLLEILEDSQDASGWSEFEWEIHRQCRNRLEKARACLMPDLWASENHSLFWRLLHQVDADVLLIMPLPALYARGLVIQQEFSLNITHPALRCIWVGEDSSGRIPRALKVLEAAMQPQDVMEPDEVQIARARLILVHALRLVNTRVDDANRQLAVNVLMMAWSGGFLALLLAILLLFVSPTKVVSHLHRSEYSEGLRFGVVLILGAIGGHIANMASRSGYLLSNGAVRRYFIYHLFAKPILSASAALLLYLMATSQLLFTITSNAPAASSGDATQAATLITFRVAANMEGYAYAGLALIAGMAAQKVIDWSSGRILERMGARADRTQQSTLDSKDQDRAP